MVAAQGSVPVSRSTAEIRGWVAARPHRHETCSVDARLEKNSRTMTGSVNFPKSFATPRFSRETRTQTMAGTCGSRTLWRGWNRGAAGYGCRKRTHVREACGDTIRPGGVGTMSSHGHFGRSVGRFRFPPPVVQRLPGGHSSFRSPLSRGPGLLAALTTRDVGFVRMPAPAGRTAPATRRRSPVVNRAVPMPAITAGTSGGWMGRTRTGPRTRLRRP